MKSIYIDSYQLHSNTSNLGVFVTPGIEGLEAPQFRLPTINLPATDGAIVPNQLYGGRLISLKGKISGQTVAEYRQNRQDLEYACRIKRVDGSLQPLTLKFTTMDDAELQVDCYTKDFKMIDKDLMFGNFKIDLFAPNFQILGQTLKISDIYIFSGGGVEIPLEVPMDMSSGASVIASLENAGNTDAFPTIIFYGPITDPVLDNQSNGDQLSVDYTILTGERIEINTKNRTALHYASASASGTNARQYVSGDFMVLQPGTNSIALATSSYNTTAFARIQWQDSYTGI